MTYSIKYEATGRPYVTPNPKIPRENNISKTKIDTWHLVEDGKLELDDPFFQLNENESIEFEVDSEYHWGEWTPEYLLNKYHTTITVNDNYENELKEYNDIQQQYKKALNKWENNKSEKLDESERKLYEKLKAKFEGK